MKEPPTIRILPDHVANKIAAGEVVERPASVLKELMENAVDAGATRIEVDVVAGGRTLIQVSDNGCGMSRDDALLSLERHATSKIREVDDIESIATLGFRGEALAAIASVSRFILHSRRASDLAGVEIIMSAGKILNVGETGCPPGTIITVRNLFFNVPARRKFLRSENTELAHVRQAFITYALALPRMGMHLKVDGDRLLDLPADSSFIERLRDLTPEGTVENLSPVQHTVADMSISGYASLPTVSRADRTEQFIFINGRPAGAPLLSAAIREAYHSLLPQGRFPILYLFIKITPDQVDVNVHPTKKEVRFRNPTPVRDAITAAIQKALGSIRKPLISPPALQPQATFPKTETPLTSASIPAWPPPQSISATPGQTASQNAEPAAVLPPPSAPLESLLANDNNFSPWGHCQILGQIGSLYVVLEMEDGLALMDPHAAHERVLYERFLKELDNGQIKSQGLLIAETADLPPVAAQNMRQHLDLFKKLGFGIAEFGGDTFVIDALPTCISGTSPRVLLPELASALAEVDARGSALRLLEERVARAACKAAVKARQQLSKVEITALLHQLSLADMPYTCPHGRPTMIHISFKELARKFGRQ